MKAKLDRTLCDGFGICAARAPGIISLDDWGYASMINGAELDGEHADPVRRAILDCPVHAIAELAPDDEE